MSFLVQSIRKEISTDESLYIVLSPWVGAAYVLEVYLLKVSTDLISVTFKMYAPDNHVTSLGLSTTEK